MFDFDLDLDFGELEVKSVQLPINALALKVLGKERVLMNIDSDTKQLEALIGEFDKSRVYKMLSVKGGFASINFIDYVSRREVIEELTVCTLAVGRKHMLHLDKLHKAGKLKEASFIVGRLFEQRGLAEKYDYFDVFIETCEKNGWKYLTTNNHAKIILMRTESNYYVLETSSNLNENPKMEQFNFEESKEVYGFYYKFCEELLKEI